MNDNMEFSHTEKAKAKKLKELVKKPDCTIEQLDNAIPYGAEAVKVISCFTNMLQEELKNDKKANQQYKDSINNVIQILKDCLHDNEITSEERIQIRDIIVKLCDYLKEVELEREKQSGKLKRWLVGAGTTLLVILALPFTIFKSKNKK